MVTQGRNLILQMFALEHILRAYAINFTHMGRLHPVLKYAQ